VVIIDTSIWIDILRAGNAVSEIELSRLLRERQAASVGIIYAELLRGTRSEAERSALIDHLDTFTSFLDSRKSTLMLAGRLLADLDRQGTPLAFADAVIAAHALEGDHSLFTRDEHFQRVPGLKLHAATGGSA
jgi:predicted nucleic acid-binding protein